MKVNMSITSKASQTVVVTPSTIPSSSLPHIMYPELTSYGFSNGTPCIEEFNKLVKCISVNTTASVVNCAESYTELKLCFRKHGLDF